MQFAVFLTLESRKVIDDLANSDRVKHQKVSKTLGLMQTNLRHTGLHAHEFMSRKGPNGEKIFEAYVENRTPAAYRVLWYYGPNQGEITVLSILPHP